MCSNAHAAADLVQSHPVVNEIINSGLLVKAPVGLLPVLAFLATLLYMDSFKLVRFRLIVWLIFGGALTTVFAYYINGYLIGALQMEFMDYSHFVAPIVEESLKGLIVVYLIARNRIGFLVDGALIGFAVGTGFAVVENLYYLYLIPDAGIAVWVIRGFGTALMHGGVTAIFAVLAHVLTERQEKAVLSPYIYAMLIAAVLHSIFNQFPISPVFSAMVVLIGLPLVLTLVFNKSSSVMHEWLEVDFDANEALLQKIMAGELSESRSGQFLLKFRDRFQPLTMADMLCYIRLHVELAIRAKSMLMAREYDMDVTVDREVRDKFEELHALERNIGKSGLLAMRPYLNMSRKELWQLFILEEQ